MKWMATVGTTAAAVLCLSWFWWLPLAWSRKTSTSTRHHGSLSAASFIVPASPTVAPVMPVSRTSPSSGQARMNTGAPTPTAAVDVAYRRDCISALSAKKKKAVAGSGTKKIQVKLLKQVAGTGQAGEVVLVTPAFFQNKLRPTKSATVISDEEVAKEQVDKAAKEREILDKANAIKERIATEMDAVLEVTRKAGPDGQLFGGVGAKTILAELKQQLATDNDDGDFLESRSVKIVSINDQNGKRMRGDIKHTGDFSATMALTKDISAKFAIKVKAAQN